MTKIVKKAVSKMTDETSIPLGGMDRTILNRVSVFIHRSGKIADSEIGKFPEKQWKEAVASFFKGRCAYCGKQNPPFEKEHIIPINKNGLGLRHVGNFVPACKDCNTKKRAYDRNEDGEGYIRFCKAYGYNDALTEIQRYMKKNGYKPFTADKAKREQIKRLINKAHKEMGLIRDEYAKKIARLLPRR
jgi:hypothetical protein